MKTRGIILIIVATLLPLAWYLPLMQGNAEGALLSDVQDKYNRARHIFADVQHVVQDMEEV